jgi:hypothetical protein
LLVMAPPSQELEPPAIPGRFSSIPSISLQNDAARTIASENEIGHFIRLQVSEKRLQAFSRCRSNILVRKKARSADPVLQY